jgi:putative two-component system response regulator
LHGGLLRHHPQAKILIVDDREAALLARLLTRHGLTRLTTVTDPRSVLTTLPDVDPDLVLLDLHLPFIDGCTMLRRIREWAAGSFAPIVAMTSDTTSATVQRALDAGATDFLAKPFNATEILIRVRNLLDSRCLWRQLQQELQPATQAGPPVGVSR